LTRLTSWAPRSESPPSSKKVVEGADRVDTEHLGEQPCNERFSFAARRRELGLELRPQQRRDVGAPDLARRRARQLLDDDDPGRDHERRQVLKCEITHRPGADVHRLTDHHGGDDIFAECLVRDAERDRILDVGVQAQRRIDGRRRHLEAPAIDELLDAPIDEKESIVVDVPQISGPEPAFEERRGAVGRVTFVPGEDLGTADDDFAHLPWRKRRPSSASIANSLLAGRPDGADARAAGRKRILRDDARLRHPVALQHRHARACAPIAPQARSATRRKRTG
jgi:hypothetical protein